MLRVLAALAIASSVAASAAVAQPASDPTAFATAAEVQAQVADMAKSMAAGQTFLWRPLVRDGVSTAALEYWKAPGRPAVHPEQGEYVIVVAGSGTLVSGGRLVDPQMKKPDLIEGSRIEGGRTRHVAVGDVFLIPAGTPHWFGIDGGRLVLLGTKLPEPVAKAP